MFPAPGARPNLSTEMGDMRRKGSSDVQWAFGNRGKRLADIDVLYLNLEQLNRDGSLLPQNY